MYRGVTSLALDRGIDPADVQSVVALARTVRFGFPTLASAKAVNPPLLADGVNITGRLRRPVVDRTVSLISSYGEVRETMVEQQRRLRQERSMVMVGRDIGTVVAQDAEVKIFLSASVEDRARRRFEERRALGLDASYEATLADLRQRDKLDSERALSPLRPAKDAIMVDTTGFALPKAVSLVLGIVRERLAEKMR
jgi:cytidylate kinase